MNKFKLSLFFILWASLFSSCALADENGYSVSEAKQAPPFCLGLDLKYFQDSAAYLKTNVKLPGKDGHHFCNGMKKILRGDYKSAVNEFDYVEGRSSSISDNELLDSVCLYKAEALGKMGQTGLALQEYNKAIQLNPKYHQAYARLADFYLKLGMKQDALDTINTGLKFSPNSKGLRNRLHKLTTEK